MDLPTYTNIWRIEKRLYKLYDLRLPMPLPIVWIGVFVGVVVPWSLLLWLIGVPMEMPWHVLFLVPPGIVTWLSTRPVIEGKRLTELLESQLRYLGQPRAWYRLAPQSEPETITFSGRVWRVSPARVRVKSPRKARQTQRKRSAERATGPRQVRPAVAAAAAAAAQAPVAGQTSPRTGWGSRTRQGAAPALSGTALALPPPRPEPVRDTPAELRLVRDTPVDVRTGRDGVRAGRGARDDAPAGRDAHGEVRDAPAATGRADAPVGAVRETRDVPAEVRSERDEARDVPAEVRSERDEVRDVPAAAGEAGAARRARPAATGKPMDTEALRRLRRLAASADGPPPSDASASPAREDGPAAEEYGREDEVARNQHRKGQPPRLGPALLLPEAQRGWSPLSPDSKPVTLSRPLRGKGPEQESPALPVRHDAALPPAAHRDDDVPARHHEDPTRLEGERGPSDTQRPAEGATRSQEGDEDRARPARDEEAGHAPTGQEAAPASPRRPAEHERPAASRRSATDEPSPRSARDEPSATREPSARRGTSAERHEPVQRLHAVERQQPDEPRAVEPSAVEPRTVEAQSERPSVERPSVERQTVEPSAVEAPAERPAVERPAAERSSVEPVSAERPQVSERWEGAAGGHAVPVPRAGEREGRVRRVESVVGRDSGGWRRIAQVVVGGSGVRTDGSEIDEARARGVFSGSRRVVVLGCTGGAGQSTTALMLGHTFARYRDDRVVAVDAGTGGGSLTSRIEPETPETLTSLLAGLHGVSGYLTMRGFTTRTATGLEVVGADSDAEAELRLADRTLFSDRRLGEALSLLDRHYKLTVIDPAAALAARVLPYADQLVLVVPASEEAPEAVAMTYEWLDGHGCADLRRRAVMVVNGVSRRSMADVEQAEAVASGRCRAIVRVPWEDDLAPGGADVVDPGQLRAAGRRAYLALAGVVVAGFAAQQVRPSEEELASDPPGTRIGER